MTRTDDALDGQRDGQLDWALRERFRTGADRDLAAAVLARHRAGERGPALAFDLQPATKPRAWLAAALIVLGIGVVLGVAFWQRAERAAVPAQQGNEVQGEAPKPAVVYSAADIAALPAHTRAVVAEGIDDADLRSLLALRELEDLEVRCSPALIVGLGLKTSAPAPRSITAAAFATLAQFTKLRRLRLRGTFGVNAGFPDGGSGPGPEAIAAATLGQLERLPLLAELSLAYIDTPDYALAVLPRLRTLRRIDLEANHGFTGSSVAVIAQCTSLRAVSLRFCQQLNGEDLARLGALPELTELDLGGIDGINWRNNLVESPSVWPHKVGSGVTDEALVGIGRAPKLSKLDISGGHFTRIGLASLAVTNEQQRQAVSIAFGKLEQGQRALRSLGAAHPAYASTVASMAEAKKEIDDMVQKGAMSSLRELDMSGSGGDANAGFVADLPKGLQSLHVCGNYDDEFCRAVHEHLFWLRELDVAACYRITDAGVAELVAIPTLRRLDLRQMYGLTRASLAHLEKARQLEWLDLRNNDFVLVGDVRTLLASLPKLKTLESNFTAGDIARDEEHYPEQVGSAAQAANLPAGLRSVQGNRLGDDDVRALARFQKLERLVLTTPEAIQEREHTMYTGIEVKPGSTITDAALPSIGQLGKLRFLSLAGNHGIVGPGLAELAKCPLLQTLDLSCFDLDDDALVTVSRLQQVRDLDLSWNHGFGERGLRAVLQMRGLWRLSLHGCSQLHDSWLADLGQLTQLTELDLGGIDGQHWRLGLAPATERSQSFLRNAQAMAVQPGAGLGDAAIASLASLRNLVVLDVGDGKFTADALVEAVGKLSKLEQLTIHGIQLPVTAAARLPASLRVFDARGFHPWFAHGSGQLGDEFLTALAEHCRELVRIELDENQLITDYGVHALAKLPHLQWITLSRCPKLTRASLIALANAHELGAVNLRGQPWMTKALADELQQKVPSIRSVDFDGR